MIAIERAPYRRGRRCVICGCDRDRHHEGVCPGRAQGFYATMNLPDGKTCGDCVHMRRCNALFGRIPEDERCDFYPSRFQPGRELMR